MTQFTRRATSTRWMRPLQVVVAALSLVGVGHARAQGDYYPAHPARVTAD